MVQICSECNAKHVNSAETMTDKHSDSGRSLTFGNGGRFSPSDSKSQANSDSSFVRFKVIFKHTMNQESWTNSGQTETLNQFKFYFSHMNRWQHTQYRVEIVIWLIHERILDLIPRWHSQLVKMVMEPIRK